MSVNDFNRFLCVLTTLQFNYYEVYFSTQKFPELLEQSSTLIKEQVHREYSSIWEKIGLDVEEEKYEQWLFEFWEQMPLKSQKKKYKSIFLDNIYA